MPQHGGAICWVISPPRKSSRWRTRNPHRGSGSNNSLPNLKYTVADYRELLDKPDIDAVYCAIPHVLHEQAYCDIIRSGKHLMGEKPFGMDRAQNRAIMGAIAENPGVFVRCSSQFPYFPACQELIDWIREERFGKIIEIRAGFRHSSDLDLAKPINWKRKIEINGEYGCLGDLGIHTQHVPFRMGFMPIRVYAQLSKLVSERPDGRGGTAKCETWDNAMLMCDVVAGGNVIPMRLETKRMAPGCTNEWFIEIDGMQASARFSTDDPNAFKYTVSAGKEQAWCRMNVGYKPQFKTITGGIFEFGFTDAILADVGGVYERDGRQSPCGSAASLQTETAMSHALQTAALESFKLKRAVDIQYSQAL